jgi:hypothetical protein
VLGSFFYHSCTLCSLQDKKCDLYVVTRKEGLGLKTWSKCNILFDISGSISILQ